MDEFEVLRHEKERKQRAEERDRTLSKKKLMNEIQKKIKTTMIGALATFESTFGHLWGHNKDVESLTAEEKQLREMWEQARTTVLDKGNNQARMAMSEIAQYTLVWNKYHFELNIKGKGNNE